MYYPKSQIKPNLYTSGNEYALKISPYTPYSGYYYKTSTGHAYTGKTPEDGGNVLLIPLKQVRDQSSETPTSKFPTVQTQLIKSDYPDPPPNLIFPPDRFLPSYNAPKPTKEDYSIGEFQRYFCKKTNELLYLEINKETYKKLTNSDPKIASDLYEAMPTPWSLIGTPQSVFNTNKKIIALIERNQKWYGFTNYFRDRFSEYYLEE